MVRSHVAEEPISGITCPNCGQQITLDEALRHQLAADLIARREAELRDTANAEADKRVRAELDSQQARLKESEERLAELGAKVREHQEAEKQLLRKQRELEDQKEAWDLERERMRGEIRRQEREEAEKAQRERYDELTQHMTADHKTEVRKLQDQIERMKAQLEDAARRGVTGSRQEEGFARQDVFAAALRDRFGDDQITVTRRGQAGADITQVVRLRTRACGTILWECKRTATWSATWTDKLAAEVQKAGASLGVIVSEALPPGVDGSGRVGDVWVCDFASAAHLAAGLRGLLIAASQYEAANAARADTAGRVYDYIATGGFASRCQTISRTIEAMVTTLGKEKRYYELRWREWERDIEVIAASLYGIAGDLVGIGADVPPPLRAELPDSGPLALGEPTR